MDAGKRGSLHDTPSEKERLKVNMLSHEMLEAHAQVDADEKQEKNKKGDPKQTRVKSYQFLREAVQFAGSVHIQDFTPAAQQRFVELRKQYRRIGTNDLRIAAIVLEHNATLVTANVRDFRTIDGINIEDWTG